MKHPAVVLVVVCLLSLSAEAQQNVPKYILPDTLSVSAEGKFEADPDTAVLNFNISAQETTSKAAYDRASRAAEQIRQLLRSNGVDPKSAEIGYFAIAPVEDYRSPKRKVVGYRVNSNVTVKLKDFSKIGPIVQQLSDLDITDDQSISYILEQMDAAKIKAAEDGFYRARAEAEAIAKAGGRVLGSLTYASVDTYGQIRPVTMRTATTYRAEAAMAPAPTEQFTPNKITVTAQVEAVFGLRY